MSDILQKWRDNRFWIIGLAVNDNPEVKELYFSKSIQIFLFLQTKAWFENFKLDKYLSYL